ncbi:MAG TPA: hypothetical protein VLG25_01965 [Patescibacteria group bacterium]|nr:hypothetical protein [Patescibacteria group bacterium]
MTEITEATKETTRAERAGRFWMRVGTVALAATGLIGLAFQEHDVKEPVGHVSGVPVDETRILEGAGFFVAAYFGIEAILEAKFKREQAEE